MLMENVIIAVIICAICAVGIVRTVGHFSGKGGCCGGGGSYALKHKRIKNVRYQRTFKVDGMHCDNCKRRVEETIDDIHGISGRVDLKKGELVVSYAEDVPDEVIIERIERLGYDVSR